MESLETTAGVKSSTEGQDRNVAQKKCTSEAAQTKRSPSVELEGKGWHQQLQEGQSTDTCGFKEMSDSGKSLQLEDQHSQIQSTSHQDYDVSSYPQQSTTKSFPTGRQKAVGHLVSAQSPGPASSHRKSTSSPEVQQQCSHSGMDQLSETTVGKVEQKPQKPGKYVCDYCGRACAKPSVLKKHIRSHTGERPYPCVPCGFSFKTKSNLYKHRKSHAHSVKAGTVPLSELGSYNANTDQGSFEGEGELFSDAEQSTDTDEDTLNDPLLLLDSPVEGSDNTAVKVLNLIAQKKGATSVSAQDGSSQPQEINAPPAAAEASRAIQSCTIKQRLALRLSEKRSSDSDHNLSLPSQSSKGSTDSGYFSRSESTEHQTGPPNTNAKSYQEIMFGKCYRPSPKQTAAFVACSTDSSEYTGMRSEKGVSRVFTQEKDTVESIKINTKSFTREEVKEPLLDAGSDVGPLIRSNSMPTSSAVCLPMPQALRGSHSFDERTSTGGMRRLRRQAAFELSAHDGHADAESHGKMGENAVSPSGLEMENYPSAASNMSHQRHAMELATRKRRKEKREEEDLPGQYEAHHEQCEEMFDSSKDYDSKQAAAGMMALGKGHSSSMLSQMDRCDMDISVSLEMSGRKTLGNVISVIQHTNSINRPYSEQSDSYKYHAQRQESISSFQAMEASESYEMERSDSRLRQSFQMGPKLVRQPNIQVPEIRVTVEPDSPEKAPEVQVKEPEKHMEEFQWPQRSETLAQFPPEKLPPKKKRLRLADIEHSSGESSFESACTSLSRSPSQDSNLSYSSTFSFDREESLKSVSPARQDEFGKPLELLAVPGSGHSLSVLNQRQQHEMRRSSSEQAPCNLRKEFPEVRSISFDYGSLSPTSKVRHVDINAVRERRRGNLVRQESLNMDTEVTQVPSQVFPHQYLGSTSPPFTAVALLPQTLPIFSTGNTFPQLSHPSLLVPVRIQTHVPSYGSITYTSVSQIFDNQYDGVSCTTSTAQNQTSRLSGNLDSHSAYTRPPSTHTLNVEALDLSSAKLKTGIPLSLTSRTISTTNASSGGANKRMLSPASSLDLFMEVRQQKRVKEERMFGQIVEELSAVELGKCNLSEEKGHRSEMQGASTPHAQDDSRRLINKFITLQQKVTEATDHGFESAMESSSPPYSMISVGEVKEVGVDKRAQMDMVAQLVTSQDVLTSDAEHPKPLSQFPSLRTTTGVSWCYLNYTKPSCSHSNAPFSSVYATWCVSSHNPNPLELSTSAALALLQSKQRGDKVIYTVAAMCQPGTGKLVSSLILWRQTVEQLQRKPEPKEVDITYGKKVKDIGCRVKTTKEEWKEREATTSAAQTMPTRIKIFEGGYKSNEDYVYVRGRGRGKYICEECGIRCKKPSMLKKHIRTHTDVRPYICRVCNFAFKTKGNLTKHMKSKAHMKKCLELGVSVTMDEAEIQEHVDDIQQESKTEVVVTTKHQFSDAEDSDGMDEEVDEIDEDDDEDDEYEGDSTPKLRSRSTSPQPCGVTSLSVTATAAIHGYSLTSLPDADVRQQSSGRRTGSDHRPVLAADQREKSVDEDSLTMLSPDQASFLFDPYSSCLLSPGWESPIREPSPSRLRYPSPRRELSPRGRSSPRWDTSPLRPGSPSFTPIQHLSPGTIERPMSPGTELAGKRESSVRGRQRVVLRAVSPRRGSHQHKGGGDKTRHQAKMEMAQQQAAFEMEMDQRSSLASSLPAAASSHHQNILSHLPLHSQQQAHSLLPVVPVGGLQMLLHSPPSSSGTDVTASSAPSPQSSEGQRCSSREGSVHGLETGGDDIRGQNQLSSHPAAQEKSLDPGVSDSRQEENVQTCLKAIASLKITTEDPH
ncbi:Transcription factor HIVEP2 [Larimichthys crocea]|uniref:Transcription factor HIVEP2 n=1 Tax=Larimichthys crocea TaxID=215358 RepID=A0A6G0IFE3_LARCR|nr:Transcription factor HIVEP2 [Larimichthys crocea]